jgi:hypothetical protein
LQELRWCRRLRRCRNAEFGGDEEVQEVQQVLEA